MVRYFGLGQFWLLLAVSSALGDKLVARRQDTTTTEPPRTTTLDPQLFSCVDRPDGTHPHPFDCSKYVSCKNETTEGVHTCPPPLLYDTTTRNCNLPSLVDCGLSCVNKEDGTHPHPHDCKLFIVCIQEYLFVYSCMEGFLFDPRELYCRPDDVIQCEIY